MNINELYKKEPEGAFAYNVDMIFKFARRCAQLKCTYPGISEYEIKLHKVCTDIFVANKLLVQNGGEPLFKNRLVNMRSVEDMESLLKEALCSLAEIFNNK